MQKNYYQILRIKDDASAEQIAQAYRRALDRVAQSGIEDPDTLALLKDAHETLSDPRNRAAYDQSLGAPPEPPPRLRTAAAPAGEISMEDDEAGGDRSGAGVRGKWGGLVIAAGAAHRRPGVCRSVTEHCAHRGPG